MGHPYIIKDTIGGQPGVFRVLKDRTWTKDTEIQTPSPYILWNNSPLEKNAMAEPVIELRISWSVGIAWPKHPDKAWIRRPKFFCGLFFSGFEFFTDPENLQNLHSEDLGSDFHVLKTLSTSAGIEHYRGRERHHTHTHIHTYTHI